MEEKKTSRVAVTVDSLNIGDIIFLSDKEEAVSYTVLDKGNPFILIENNKSHFCNLYRPNIIYKSM